MAKYQFEVDGDASVESVASSVALLASGVFTDRFADNQEEWAVAMVKVAWTINELVRQAADMSQE